MFLASHEPMPGSPRFVAIKRILSNLADEPSFLKMFLDEARVLSRLYHPNLDRVLDAGKHEGLPYIVLDYIPGRDLSVVLRIHEKRSLLPVEVCAHIAAKVAAGLSHAHGLTDEKGRSLEIVHRDVSPENIIITFEGTVKVVDFGVARGTIREQQTAPGLIKGKPSFMAPEQILAQQIDRRADVFALGVLLYRLTVGQHPFGVDSDDASTFRRLIENVPTPPHLLVPKYPRTLSAVVMKALEKEPSRRHQTAERFLADIENVMHEQRWFPSDRRLAWLMGELFPAGAASARRLSLKPSDANSARHASYMTRGDLRIAVDVDDEDEDTEMATEPAGEDSPLYGEDEQSGTHPSHLFEHEVAELGDSLPSDMDSVTAPTDKTPQDMDSITDPGGPAGSGMDDRTTPERRHPADMDSATKPARPTPSHQPAMTHASLEGRPAKPSQKLQRPADTVPRPEHSQRVDEAPPTKLGRRKRPHTSSESAASPSPKEQDIRSVSQSASTAPRVHQKNARDSRLLDSLPPDSIDRRLSPETEDTRDNAFSALSTHPGDSQPGLGPNELEEEETRFDLPEFSRSRQRRSKPRAASASDERGHASRHSASIRKDLPPWRTPTGIAIAASIGTAVLGAILLSLCGS